MQINTVYKKVEPYIKWLFNGIRHRHLFFHNFSRTQNVVKYAIDIAKHCDVTGDDTLILLSAAWFHDCGHLFTGPKDHELMGCAVMRKFMEEHKLKETEIAKIEECIMVTKEPHHPKNLLEQIMCDADTYYLATQEFQVLNEKLMQENLWRASCNTTEAFKKASFQRLFTHEYWTKYCKKVLNKGKMSNVNAMRKELILH